MGVFSDSASPLWLHFDLKSTSDWPSENTLRFGKALLVTPSITTAAIQQVDPLSEAAAGLSSSCLLIYKEIRLSCSSCPLSHHTLQALCCLCTCVRHDKLQCSCTLSLSKLPKFLFLDTFLHLSHPFFQRTSCILLLFPVFEFIKDIIMTCIKTNSKLFTSLPQKRRYFFFLVLNLLNNAWESWQ